MTSSGQALVEVTGIEKRFGTTRALHDVSLSIKAGQCLGLVGRNGAGKSTLVSILSGLVEPDAGTVAFGGEPAPRVGDTARWHEWIATVFQHSMIVPDLSVAENVFLGSTPGLISWRAMRNRTSAIMGDWGFDIAAGTLCRDLSVEQLQIVEIARALARGAKCVLLDEPTATLERDAGRRLFDRVRQLTAGGVAVLYISHHLEEVFEICQDVAVLRDGEMVLAAPTAGLSRDDLVVAMVGASHAQTAQRSVGRPSPAAEAPAPTAPSPTAPGASAGAAAVEDVVLSVENLTADSTRGRLSGVSLQVRAGEIVGVTGLLSAGVATIGRVVGRGRGKLRRRGPGARAARPVRAARRRPARGRRLHPRGPPQRRLRLPPRRRRERHHDDHEAAGRPLRVAQPGPAGDRRGPAHPQARRWCRPAPASRSASCPAATSRR